jgi:hypothetical protein
LYLTGGTDNCGGSHTTFLNQPPIANKDFPVTDSQITGFENQAIAGGYKTTDNSCDPTTSACDYDVTHDNIVNGRFQGTSLGPGVITGDLNITVSGSFPTTFNVTGTLYVKGHINISCSQSCPNITLDSGYGSFGGVIIADNKIYFQPGNSNFNTALGKFLIISNSNDSTNAINLSTTSSPDPFFFAPNGGITINSTDAYGIGGAAGNSINITGSVTYNTGLQDAFFSSGPGGASWEVKSWQEK